MNEEQQLLAELNARILGGQCRCKLVSGMWIIEVVHPGINSTTKQRYVDELHNAVRQIQSPSSVWKYFLYSSDGERFVEDGTLHTVEQSYSSDGIATTTLAAEDCYLAITAFDAEAMQLGHKPGLEVLGRELRNDSGQVILKYRTGTNYLWMESLGGNFAIAQNGTRQLADGNIVVTLR